MRIPSRRAVLAMAAVLCPVLAAGYAAGAQTLLPSGLFDYERLPVRSSGSTRIRQVLTGLTHTGYRLDLHVTELAPGQMPHPPHSHVHEELVLIRQGTLEISAGTRTERLGAGSAFYVASGEQHGWRNVGSTPAEYFVLALGDDTRSGNVVRNRPHPPGPSSPLVRQRECDDIRSGGDCDVLAPVEYIGHR